jgi:hypothetical protein
VKQRRGGIKMSGGHTFAISLSLSVIIWEGRSRREEGKTAVTVTVVVKEVGVTRLDGGCVT